MRPVAIGSRAEHGSSIRITSGPTATVRAMQSRCCWPPDMPSADFFSLEKTGDPGRLVELDDTDKIFSNPSEKRTEDYITGRFG